MSYEIMGITGPAQCGKDTAADYLIERLGFIKASFADPLKKMLEVGLGLNAAQLYGSDKEAVDHRYECSPRHIMQTLGTEWGRELIHPDIWVRAMGAHIKPHTVIPDVRFENEAAFIRERGVLIHITGRGGLEGDHESELGVDFKTGDLTVCNDRGLESLYAQLDAIDSLRG